MTAEDDIEGLAAEYVLGSLDPAERRQVAERRKTDAALDDAVKAWEQRLGPLAEQVPGIEPPPHLLESILSRISPQGAQIIAFSPPGKSRRGRTFAIASGALAACIALAVAWLISTHSNQPATLVAELHRPAGSTADASHTPAFVVTVDVAAR
jgi:anti-sigma-K factor RskA